jgi:hypothetical protein
MEKIKLTALAAVAMALSSCASLSGKECRAGDWEHIGYGDGAQGYAFERLESHREACAEYAIVPDEKAYERGRMHGLDNFCTPLSGYRAGANGYNYGGVCPRQSEPAFLRGYDLGLHAHDISYQMQSASNEIQQIRDRLQRRNELDDQERDRLFYRLGAAQRDYEQLENDYRHIEWEAQGLR